MKNLDLDAQDMKNILEALVKEPYYKVAQTIAKIEAAVQQPAKPPKSQKSGSGELPY